MLSEDKRKQLDDIVQKMVANKESDDNIKFVVSDFKTKYSQVTETKPKKDLLQKATDIATSIFPGGKVGESIGTLAGLGLSKLKGTSEFYDTSAPQPSQVVGDIGKGAAFLASSALAPATSLAGKTAQYAALGAASSGAGALAEKPLDEQTSVDILKETGKGTLVGGATGLAFGLAGKGIKSLSNLLGKTGDKIQTSVIKPSAADIKDGFSMDTIKKYNLGGSLKQTFEKTDTKLDELSKQLNTKIQASGKSPVLNLNKVYENTAKKLLGNKLESFGANTQMEGAIEKLRNEISAVAGKNGLVSTGEGQTIKRAAGHFGAWTFGNPTPEATASQKVYNTFYNELKTAIEKASPAGVKEINQEISKLIPVMNALIKRIPVAERNSSLSLTDIISLSAASLNPSALSVSLLNLASKSGRVGAALSKAPEVGEKVAKVVQKAEPLARAVQNK